MNVRDLKRAAPILLANKIVPFLWGAQGVGKTQVVKQIAEENGYEFVHLHLATQEVGDLVGLLIETPDGQVKHARPEWFPTKGKGIVFCDEMNRAHPDVLQAMFSFVTGGTIHTHKLPDEWVIVAAGNYQSSMFNVTDTSDAAWMSRFCHIDFSPTKEEFIAFAENKKLDQVADFIRTMPDMLETKPKDSGLNMGMISPDRRSWVDMIGRLESEINLEEMRYEVYSGIIGIAAASAFIQFKAKGLSKLRGKDILNNYSKIQAEVKKCSDASSARFDLLNTAADELLALVPDKELTEVQMNNFKQFLLDVPLELGLKIVNNISKSDWSQKNDILNNQAFVGIFKEMKLA